MRAIVLTSTHYADDSYMVDLFTDELGFVVVSVKVGKRSRVRQGHIQPLMLLNVELKGKPSQRVMQIVECQTLPGAEDLGVDISKSLTAQFLAELLHRILHSTQRDDKMFQFIYDSILSFAVAHRGAANFHLVFLVKFTHYLGFFPNLEGFDSGVYFDLVDGRFVASPPYHHNFISSIDTIALAQLMRIDYETMYLYALNREQRNRILDYILQYYRLHLSEFGRLHSLDVLRDMAD